MCNWKNERNLREKKKKMGTIKQPIMRCTIKSPREMGMRSKARHVTHHLSREGLRPKGTHGGLTGGSNKRTRAWAPLS